MAPTRGTRPEPEHQAVLSNLYDLQARLRGDPASLVPPCDAPAPRPTDRMMRYASAAPATRSKHGTLGVPGHCTPWNSRVCGARGGAKRGAGNVPNRSGVDPHGAPRAEPSNWTQKSAFLQPNGGVIDVCDGHPCYAAGWTGP